MALSLEGLPVCQISPNRVDEDLEMAERIPLPKRGQSRTSLGMPQGPFSVHPQLAIRRAPGRGYRKARCTGCGLPLEQCLCASFSKLNQKHRFSILMHAGEVGKPSATARLLALWLHNTQLVVRGQNDPQGSHLQAVLDALPANTVVLFPTEDAKPVTPELARDRQLHVLVPDGTWAQARRILRRNLLPLGLPLVKLTPPLDSIYSLRRHSEDSICTFEAVAYALGALGYAEHCAELVTRFQAWIERATAVRTNQDAEGLTRKRLSNDD